MILDGQYQHNVRVVGHTPVTAHTTGSATATRFGNFATAHGSSTTTFSGVQPIVVGRHNQGIVVKMFREGDPADSWVKRGSGSRHTRSRLEADIRATDVGVLTVKERVLVVAAVWLAMPISLAVTASGDDYKEATDAAYCVGAIQRNIELTKKDFRSLDVRSDEQSLARQLAFLQGAIKQKKIDDGTAGKLTAVGRADAQLCWKISAKCLNEATKRLDEGVDQDRSDRMLKNCERSGEAVCKRVGSCE